MCKDKLVVVATYGTLKRGGVLCRPDQIVCSREAVVDGTLFMVSDGVFPFPGVCLGTGREVIVELQVIPEEYMKMMDFLEGGMYERKEILTKDGTPCYIYEYQGGYTESAIIESGRWTNN